MILTEITGYYFSCIKEYFCNEFVSNIPSRRTRNFLYRKIGGMLIGKDCTICLHCRFSAPWNLTLGNNVAINQFTYIDSRGKVTIGDNVNVGRAVSIYTGSHAYNSKNFDYITSGVDIQDNTWIASHSVILPGVKVFEGGVAAAGSIVTHNVERYSVVAGNPAKKIKDRSSEINYKTKFFQFLY